MHEVQFWEGGRAERSRTLDDSERQAIADLERMILETDDADSRLALSEEIDATRTRFAEERRRLRSGVDSSLY